MATFVKKNSRPTNGGNVNKNIKEKEEGRWLILQERTEKKYPFDDDDVQGMFDELMAGKAIFLLEPKWPAEVNKTNEPNYCPYHRIISHLIKDCYVFKDIFKDMIRRGEIEIERAAPKGPTASSIATSTIEQKDDSYLSSS